jgi:stearoyl-CoA desaturase (delta-9 desaturase)
MSTNSESEPRFNLLNALGYFGVHVSSAIAVLYVEPRPEAIALAISLYFLRMFGITGGYHRYFSHRSFKTGRLFQFVLALLGTTAAQKGPLWWASEHRHHHLHSDTPADRHSPRQHGFLWAHMGWFLSTQHQTTNWRGIPDFARFAELRWLNRFHVVPPVMLAGLTYLGFGLPGLAWGFGVSTVCCWHATYLINSLAHIIGSRRYSTDDDSRNSLLLALLTLGEGWHNNHHRYPTSARQGFFPWEIDVTYYVLLGLSALGLVWDLRPVPEAAYRVNSAAAENAQLRLGR